ncbi:MAG: NAD(P)-dependent oxidoreductase [Candidatus Omnitrophota bacterium]
MKVLVTGATGFIGNDLVKELVKKGYDVVSLVRKTSKTDLLEKMGIRYIICDMMDPKNTEEAFDRIQPEIVVHAAAQVMGKDEKVLREINVTTTRNIAQACWDHSVKRLVYLSSVSVISGNKDVPLSEDLPYKASNAYGRSKIEAERVVIDFRNKGLKTAIVRPCMVYGPEEPHMLDTIFDRIRKKYIPILCVPEIDSKLHLAYISNVVEMLILAIEKDEALEGTFMVADEEAITIRKFLEIAYDEMNHTSPIAVPAWIVRTCMVIPFFRKEIKGMLKDRVYDISRAKDLLGYAPKISTEDGLRNTIRCWKGTRK